MSIRPLFLASLLLLLGGLSVPPAHAQGDAPMPRFYGLLSAGATTTVGNEDASFGLGPTATAVTGGVSVRLHRALAVDLTQTGAFGSGSSRWTTRLGGRLIWTQRLASPYVFAGLSGTASNGFNVGGTLGLGLDWTASPRFDLFQQVTFDLPFGTDAFGESTRGLGFVGGGLRMRIAPFVRPVHSLSVVAPDTARVREAVSLQAIADASASRPIEYFWTFDDGYTATGEIVTREFRYARPYTATVVARNRDGSFRETETLEVHPAPAPKTEEEPVITGGSAERDVEILDLYGRRTLDVNETENFRLRLARRVTNQIHYDWDFGDGVISLGNPVTHRYASPGTYTLRAIARTHTGADTVYATVRVGAPTPATQPQVVAATPQASALPPAAAPVRTANVAATTASAVPPAPPVRVLRTPAPKPPPSAEPPPASEPPPAPEPEPETEPEPATVASPPAPEPAPVKPEPEATPAPAPPPPAPRQDTPPAPRHEPPARKASPPSPPAAAPPAGPFGWMVAGFRDRAQADALATRARNATLAAQVVADVSQGPAIYRVIVGNYPTEEVAKRERYKAQALTRGPVRLTPLNEELSP